MAVDSVHPLYSDFLPDWEMMEDVYAGERAIKMKRETYLPATSGMRADGMGSNQPGRDAYESFLRRAVFHEFVGDTVESLIGVMHRKPATIELPAAMESMREVATLNGESLQLLLRRINVAQLTSGRFGLLLDIMTAGGVDQMYVATYEAKTILNWDDGSRTNPILQNLNLVTLDEMEYERTDDFEWEEKEKTRVLILGEPDENEPSQTAVYKVGVFDEDGAFVASDLESPSWRGRTLNRIPFVFVNGKDVVPEPDDPPLAGLARLSLAIYRGEADYRQSLFMQGQDTFVIIGSRVTDEDEARVGAGAFLELTQGSDAKYVGVSSQGLAEQRQSLENDKALAAQKGASLLDDSSKQKESGEALHIRVAAKVATLNMIALTGAFALQTILRYAAEWMGLNPEEVIVEPNLDFSDERLEGQELVQLQTAKKLGAPISARTIHKVAQDRGLTELTYEEELEEIALEEPLVEESTAMDDEDDNEEEDA